MASVEVFVDDAVRGRLPYLCAKTGRPADGVQRIEQKMGGNPWLALLLLVPGLGWILLLVALLLSPRRSTLTVRLPMSHEALAVERWYRRLWYLGSAGACAFVVAAIARALAEPPSFWLVPAAAALLVAVVGYVCWCWACVGVRLDASRRWVTLTRVDDRFRDAVLHDQRAGLEHHPS